MAGYQRVRDNLQKDTGMFTRLDAAQLVKHAFALQSAVHRKEFSGKQPVLLYLYAEPKEWPNKLPVPSADIDTHRTEIRTFTEAVAGNEVVFHACSYRELLSTWSASASEPCRTHAAALAARFDL